MKPPNIKIHSWLFNIKFYFKIVKGDFKMKRLFPITLMVMLILTLAITGCGGSSNPGDGNPKW